MKIKRTVILISVAALCGVIGCGSDDGDDDDGDGVRNVSGTWSGTLGRIGDTCIGSNSAASLNFQHAITQNGEAVILNDGQNVFVGNEVGDNGLSVDRTFNETVNGANCRTTERIEYEDIVDNDDDTAGVDRRLLRTCGTNECETSYSGTGTRIGGGAVITPVPGATVGPITTPTAGGCVAINPSTAAGTFAGDGGCGISEVAYSIQSGGATIVLDPFGANGATSFATSASNPSVATSARSDLTIKGVAGYSCTLLCSAPSTFTVSCFLEGGTQCVEKF